MGTFIQKAREGSPDVLELLDETMEYLGYGLAATVTILNPGRVILWGDLFRVGPGVMERIQQVLARYAPASNLTGLRLEHSPWGEDLGALGAATLVMQHQFNFDQDSRE